MNKDKVLNNGNNFGATILGSIGDGVIATDICGNITFFNEAAEEITGWLINEVKNRKFNETFIIIDAVTNQIVESPVSNVIKSGITIGLEENSTLITKKGEYKYISASVSPIREKAGNISGAVIVFRDITRIRSIELKLRDEQNNYMKAFNSAPVGVLVIDEIGIITNVNDAALGFLNIKKENSIGKRFGDAFFCEKSFLTSKGCGHSSLCKSCEIEKASYLALQSGISTTNIEFSKVLTQNKQKKEYWFKASITPMINGNKKNAVIILMDITDGKIAEEGLKRYKVLSEKVSEIIQFVDMEGNIIDVNQAALKSYGYTYEEFLRLNVRGLRAEGAVTSELLQKCDREGMFYETVHYRKDRSQFPVEISSQGVDIGGKRVLVSIIRDITERKQNEKVIRDSEEKFRQLFQNSVDAIFVQETAADRHHGKIIEVNETACRMFQYDYDELLSLKESLIKPDVSGHNLRFYSDKLSENGHVSFKATVTKKSGSIIPVEVVSNNFYLNGKKVMITIVRDITKREKIEKALRESEEKFRNLFNNANDAIFAYEVNNNFKNEKFVEVNDVACSYIGYTREELLNMSFSDLTVEEYKNDFAGFIETLQRERNGIFETWHKTKDNRNIPVEVNVHVFNQNGKDTALSIVRDITQRKIAENSLKEAKEAAEVANRTKSEFLANMSHEIRTPLNGIVGMVDLTLLSELNHDQKENLMLVKSCANSLLKVINDILDFSKMEAGKLVIENIDFDIKSLVEEMIKTHSPCAVSKGIELNYAFSSTIPQYLVGDPGRLQQILNNLIGNAIKFTEKGEVWVKARKINTLENEVEIQFVVEDSGIGIAQEDIGKLFESFSQVDNSITRRFGGTGLGLAISKQLSEMMGGGLWVESKQGVGSKFYFTLKLQIGSKIEKHSIQAAELKRIDRPYNLLLTEDDKVNQMVITRILRERGYSVDTADNGLEAVEMCKENSYDAVLMDIQMPVMDGIEAAKRIKEKDKLTPVIAITAYALKGDRERFLAQGMDEYVSKPIKIEELFNAIDKCISIDKEIVDISDIGICIDESGEIVIKSKETECVDKKELPILDELAEAIDELKNAIDEAEVASIEILAHRIKNLSNEIGIEELKIIAFKIELSARRGDFDEVIQRVQKISHVFEVFKKSMFLRD